ncbi:hypothetical protein H4R35_007427 [Dimargaris xerosporica]|nr:hypothetical protein H4R35_007427 [Dimargaris xerosporica]
MLSHMSGPRETSPPAPATEPPASSTSGMMARLMDQQPRNATAQEQHQQRAGQLSEIFARLTAQQGQKGSPPVAHITPENPAMSKADSAPGPSSPRTTASTSAAESLSPATFGDPAIMSVRMLSGTGLRSSTESSKSRFLNHLGADNPPRTTPVDGSLLRRGSRLPAANTDTSNHSATTLGNASNGASRPLSPILAATTNSPSTIAQPHGLPSGRNLLDTLFKGSASGNGSVSQPPPPGPFGNAEFGHRGLDLLADRTSDDSSHPLLNSSSSGHHHSILTAGQGAGTGPFMSSNLPGPLMGHGNTVGLNPPLHFHRSGEGFMPPPLPPVGLMSGAAPFAGGNGNGSFLNGLGATDRSGNNGPSPQLGMSMAPGIGPLMMPPASHGAGNGQGFGSAAGPHYMHPLSHPPQHGLYPSPMLGLGMSGTSGGGNNNGGGFPSPWPTNDGSNGGGSGLLPGLPHRPLGNTHDIFASHPAAGQASAGLGGLASLPSPFQHDRLFASPPPTHAQQPQQQPQTQQQQQS